MENYKLEPLLDVERLSRCVTRVLGQNPGKFTLQGTNTYILGAHRPYILVDTGDGIDTYVPVLRDALVELEARSGRGTVFGTGAAGSNAGNSSLSSSDVPLVSDIIITHAHPDHYGGLLNVLTLLRDLDTENRTKSQPLPHPRPRIHKHIPNYLPSPLEGILEAIPSSLYTAPDGDSAGDEGDGDSANAGTPRGVLYALTPKVRLYAPGVEVEVVPTPGHTVDSVCLVVTGSDWSLPEFNRDSSPISESESESSILTADTVLGQGTAVFEDLAAYMASLERLRGMCADVAESGARSGRKLRLLPGHGPVVPSERSLEYVEGYIEHRKAREREILAVLSRPPPPSPPPPRHPSNAPTSISDPTLHDHPPYIWSIAQIVRTVYASAPENLWMAAGRGVWLCLRKGEGEGVVREVREVRRGEGRESAEGGEIESGMQRRSEADRKGEEVWMSRWCLVGDGNGGGKL